MNTRNKPHRARVSFPVQRPRFRRLIVALIALLIAARAPAAPPPSITPAQHTHQQQSEHKVRHLTRQAVEQFKTRKYDQVEATLTEALALDPDNPTNIYNMACVKSLKGDPATAVL